MHDISWPCSGIHDIPCNYKLLISCNHLIFNQLHNGIAVENTLLSLIILHH